ILNEELFASYAASGITAMEISMADHLYPSINYDELAHLSQKYGVELWSYHLPFSPFEKIDISSLDDKKREYSIKYFYELIEKASAIGIDKFVVHPSAEPIDDVERGARMECAKNSLAKLADIAEEHGAVIAVEDLPRTCLGKNSEEIEELLSADERLRVCFDTNHLLAEDFEHFIKKVGSKIITTHVSDYDYADERHWLPGEGKLDWNRMYNALKNAGYAGVWLYELGFTPTSTITRSRNLTTEDFANNAKEIFEGKKLTIVK
ncbi:MAG: sugar phosphate isomerase/epimerase family protein, partial [Clostridia bacterium]|nr:sugar phosphate isomerase/epimerase family protein [Clostridia bacterium]